MAFSILDPLELTNIEKQALIHISATKAEIVSTRAKILIALSEGKSTTTINREIGVSRGLVSIWRKKWVESDLKPCNWDDAIAKAEEILGGGKGRPKKLKVTRQVSKVVEISEWHKANKPIASTHAHNELIATEAVRRGIVPEISSRTVGRLLEEHRKQKVASS
jgi:Homeodomain-like domain